MTTGNSHIVSNRQHRLSDEVLANTHKRTVVPQSAATQPAAPTDVGADEPTHRPVLATRACAAPVARPTVPRHALKVGAECLNWARSDLRGGRRAIDVPTAIKDHNPGCRRC